MIVLIVLGWLAAIILALITASMILLHNWLQALVLLVVILLVLPPVVSLLGSRLHFSIHPLIRGALIAGLLFVFVRLLIGTTPASIYRSPEIQARFYEMYDEKMGGWPVPYDDLFVETRYGRVHVVASGPLGAPPMLLLHASGVAAWSWKFNVGPLSRHFRTYAVDLIGDAGKSEYANLAHTMKTGRDQAELYTEITDALGIERSHVVGASEGGFIGSNYALYAPERVEKLALLAPMGYSGATASVMRIAFSQFFPLAPIHRATFRWAFSDSPRMIAEFEEWFSLLMKGCYPQKVAPLPLPAQLRRSISVPVMFVFGRRDNLVGDPVAARELVQDMPNVRVEIVEAGHLMGGEAPDEVNALLEDFFSGGRPGAAER